MLEKFRERFHGADLVCSPADSYLGEEKYDLVFSNAVVQYLGKSKLSLMIDNMSRMLNPRGVIVLGMIPWKSLKTAYYSGDIARSHTPFLTRLARFVKTRIRDQMGNWYAWEDLRRIAEKHGLEAFFYGSLTDPYRFHVVLLRTSEFSGQQDEFTQRLFASRRR
jgi:trans-aconitate methyltransferase